MANKIVLIGQAGIGKTNYVYQIAYGRCVNNYNPTLGVEVTPIRINGNTYNIWDTAGVEKYKGLGDAY